MVKKILVTGGSGRILKPDMREGLYLKRYILFMGVKEEDLILESKSQNTHENALYTKKILEDQKFTGRLLLVTSAFHMRRALGCFETVGLDVEPYSTDRFAGPRKFEFDHLFIPNASIFSDWNQLIHEWVGAFVYKFTGYS